MRGGQDPVEKNTVKQGVFRESCDLVDLARLPGESLVIHGYKKAATRFAGRSLLGNVHSQDLRSGDLESADQCFKLA